MKIIMRDDDNKDDDDDDHLVDYHDVGYAVDGAG